MEGVCNMRDLYKKKQAKQNTCKLKKKRQEEAVFP